MLCHQQQQQQCLGVMTTYVFVCTMRLQERRIAELESQLSESQQQLEAAQSNRTVTQEALDQASSTHLAIHFGGGGGGTRMHVR